MAITLIAAVASGFTAAIGTSMIFSWAAFAIGAGLSLVSRALMPKINTGSQMGGRSVTTREAAHSRKIIYGRARIGGNIVYLESTGDDNKYLWLVVAVAGHEIDAYESVWFNDKKIWGDGNYFNNWGSFVSIYFYKGDQTAADSALVSASSKWTADHKLLDTAYMVLKLTYDVDKFANGLPNISTIVRGKKVLDPSDNSTAWSDNPALCAYDYLRDTKYGLGETAANILTASVTTAKGVCDETVSLAAGGTQKRYTINGVVDTANSIKSNIEQMLGSMIGRLVYSGGQFEIHAGAYVAPAFTVDESVAVGEITVQTKQSRRNAYNGVKGVFLSEDDNYILADYPAQISSSYATADGDPIYLDMALPFTTNNIRAQRIAKLALFRSRQQEAITIPCNLSALRFKVGENINVTNARLGYNNKIFEVVGYSMDFASDGQILVNVDAIETASSIWAWAASDQEVFLGGGEVALYDGTVAQPPTSINVTSDSFLSDDGTFNSQFNVAWTNADDAFTDHYVVEWKLASVSNYFSQTTKSTPFSIVNLVNNASYNVRVKAVNEIRVSSAYLSATTTSAVDTTAPSVPSSISATAGFQSISLQWTNPSQKDFTNVEIYRATSSGGTYAPVSSISAGFGAKVEHLDGDLADAAAYHYKFKSVDFTGNKSAFSGIVTATTYKIDTANIANDAVETAQIADEAVQTDQIDDDAVTIAKIATSLQSTNYSSGSAGWKILKSGVVEFEQATIRGEVIAATGTIGGYTINSNSLFAGDGSTRVSLSTADGISLGSNTFGSAPFRVTRAGALTANNATLTSATVSGAITATDLTVTNATVTGVFAANNVPNMQNLNGVIAANQINAGTIAVNKLTGDVTESYPLMLYPNLALSNSVQTVSSFSLPTPALSLSKRQKLAFNTKITIRNTNNSTVGTYAIRMDVQKKSKGVNAISVGTVTVVSFASFVGVLYVSGNQLGIVDGAGGIADSASPSNVSNVQGVYYDLATNRTYITYSDQSNRFSNGETAYYSDSKFTSAGTWVTPSSGIAYQIRPPSGSNTFEDVNIPIDLFFGSSTTGTDFRIRMFVVQNLSGFTFTLAYMRGFMENTA